MKRQAARRPALPPALGAPVSPAHPLPRFHCQSRLLLHPQNCGAKPGQSPKVQQSCQDRSLALTHSSTMDWMRGSTGRPLVPHSCTSGSEGITCRTCGLGSGGQPVSGVQAGCCAHLMPCLWRRAAAARPSSGEAGGATKLGTPGHAGQGMQGPCSAARHGPTHGREYTTGGCVGSLVELLGITLLHL